ncbi:MAG: tetratricopeptide repeat protein, partial [Terriglobales bacterium]
MGMVTIRKILLVGFVLLAAATVEAETRIDAEAIRLNNRGVAQMGQQLTERAEDSFAQAFKKDPKFAQAAVNEGIALLTLQKLDEAKAAFKQALALDPNSAQAWYNQGLAERSGNELEA